MNKKNYIDCGNIKVEVTSLDRILFPKPLFIKKDLLEFYAYISQRMLPYMKNHPVTMHRFPEGINHEGFYQKNAGEYFPSWIKTVGVEHEHRLVNYVVCNNLPTLLYIANQGCITPHLWLSKVDKLLIPDRMIFDLDPSGASFTTVRKVALIIKNLLEDELKLQSFVMTTGSKGLHIWVPIKRKYNFETIHTITNSIAQIIVNRYPKLTTLQIRKNKRENRIFIDYLRNSYSATAVSPYAVRALPKASIATPIFWDEVKEARLRPDNITLSNYKKKFEQEDPWQTLLANSCSLSTIQKNIDRLLNES